MHLVMFDIDGTLIESSDFDTECFRAAVKDVLKIPVDTKNYRHVTDSGILRQIIAALHLQEDHESIIASVKNASFTGSRIIWQSTMFSPYWERRNFWHSWQIARM